MGEGTKESLELADEIIDGGVFKRHMIPESRKELRERIANSLDAVAREAQPGRACKAVFELMGERLTAILGPVKESCNCPIGAGVSIVAMSDAIMEKLRACPKHGKDWAGPVKESGGER